jgi:CHASE3 domain sensor protein
MRQKLITYAAIIYALITLWLGIQFALAAKQADIADNIDTATRNLLITLLDTETGQRGYLLTGDINYLAPFDAGRQLLQARVEELAKLAYSSQQPPADMAPLYDLTKQKLAELEQTIALRRDKPDAAMLIVKTNAGKNLMDQIRSPIDALQLWAMDTQQRMQARATRLARTDFVSLVATFFLTALAVGMRRQAT